MSRTQYESKSAPSDADAKKTRKALSHRHFFGDFFNGFVFVLFSWFYPKKNLRYDNSGQQTDGVTRWSKRPCGVVPRGLSYALDGQKKHDAERELRKSEGFSKNCTHQ